MMVVKMHVDAENNASEGAKPLRKLTPSVLDSFTKLTRNQLNIRVKSGICLIKYLSEESDTEKKDFEVKYALKRLIRGLGTSNINARAGFYSALVALLSSNVEITLHQLFDIVATELQTSGSNSKSEKGEIYTSQVLTCGATLRSGLYLKGSHDEQVKVLQTLLDAGKRRSYLASAAFTFLINLFELINEKQFQNVVLPLLKAELTKPVNLLTMDDLYLLLMVQKKFPKTANGKFLEKCIGTSEIVSESNSKALCDILITSAITTLKHPVFEEFAKALVNSPCLTNFVTDMDNALFRPNRNKQILVTIVLTHICNNLTNAALLPDLLLKNFIQQTLGYFRMLKGKQKDDEYQQKTQELFASILNVLKKEDVTSKTKVKVLKKLLFSPGPFIFEKITRSKLAQQITALLDAEGVKKLATLYREVVLGEKAKESTDQSWWNKDRVYAAQLLVKLLGHPSVQAEVQWRTEQLQFLVNLTIIEDEQRSNVGAGLSASLKETFYRALDLRLPKLEDLRQLLSHLVHYIDSVLTPDNLDTILRTPLTAESYDIWKQTLSLVDKLEKKEQKKKKSERAVFHVLFLHMALQMFNDVKLATDSLKELFVCYERIKTKKDDDAEDSEDPLWIEVVVDLFLNLLSHNSHLLRSVINCVFPHLCKFLNATALHQILSVLDPKNEDNPLTNDSDESGTEGDDSEDSEEDADETDGDEEETINDKLRMAVREALGTNGYQTDEESVNADDIGEDEGRKLDEALANAFKQFRPNRGKKTKKQSDEDKALTHFRVRISDLLEIFLENDPPMDLCLEMIPSLLQSLEFCVHDDHQKPLQDRVRSCLKKLTSLRKFESVGNVDDATLTQLLQSLLDKSTKSALVLQDMGDKIAECCVFVIACSQIVRAAENTPKKTKKTLKKAVDEIITNEFTLYFTKRDSLMPYALFNNVMQLNWDRTVNFVPLLIDFAFNDDIRPFRRNQALQLLKTFYTNNRLLCTQKDVFEAKLDDSHALLYAKTVSLLETLASDDVGASKVKEKFVKSLFNLLTAVKRSALAQKSFDWAELGEHVKRYRTQATLSKDGKNAYAKLCNAIGISSVVAIVKKHPLKKNAEDAVSQSSEQENRKLEDRKRKKAKGKSNEKNKLKKEAKLLRMQSSSEGFENGVTFAGLENGLRETIDSGNGDVTNGGTTIDDSESRADATISNVKQKKRKIDGAKKPAKKIKH